jgi:hypothetical protein
LHEIDHIRALIATKTALGPASHSLVGAVQTKRRIRITVPVLFVKGTSRTVATVELDAVAFTCERLDVDNCFCSMDSIHINTLKEFAQEIEADADRAGG